MRCECNNSSCRSMTNAQITAKITGYKSSYEGKYWNKGLPENSLSESNWGGEHHPRAEAEIAHQIHLVVLPNAMDFLSL